MRLVPLLNLSSCSYKFTSKCYYYFNYLQVKGLYKGVTSPLAGVGVINAVVFGTYGNVQRYYEGGNLLSQFIAGAAAGLLQSFICSPMELAKIRLQVEKGKSKLGSLDCLIKIWKKQRIRGIYKGFSMTAIRDTPAFGVYFFTYEFLTGKSFFFKMDYFDLEQCFQYWQFNKKFTKY